MVVAELIVDVEGANVEERETMHENGKITNIEQEEKETFKVEWSDNEDDKDEESSAVPMDSDGETKSIVKAKQMNNSLLPSSPPQSPLKAEEVESDQNRSGSSRQASSNADTPRNGAKKIGSGPTQFARHLPRGDIKAHKTFETLKGNVYQNARVGRSRGHEKEAMVCDCRYRPNSDVDKMTACSDESNCINRLTQVECLKSECHNGQRCQNQRFQQSEYANVEIIETEKKGFGLRAGKDLPTDHFIYEYIGEVVEQKEFMKRMEQYRNEGIRHFYFMMLQKDEFLDATRKGGIARFVNHSCNPNCYVSKWHVGKYMRMGIFAKRDIEEGEELTFNYNVDRYGNDAQPCYCGEPNCVGSIGGKTQTDIGGMDQLFIDALGIADEVDQIEAKGTRKKRSRHLDEDFTPLLRPIGEDGEIAKVITAVRQAISNRSILQKLLSRIHMTQDDKVQRSLVRLHGFVLMAGVIEEWKSDKEIVLLAMGSMARWPLQKKNKVVDSGVDQLMKDLTKQEDPEVGSLANDLLSAWDTLEMYKRIARKEASAATNSASPGISKDLSKAKQEDQYGSRLDSKDMHDLELTRNPFTSAQRPLEAQAPNTVSKRLGAVAPIQGNLLGTSSFYEVETNAPTLSEVPSTPDTPDERPRESPAWGATHARTSKKEPRSAAWPTQSTDPRPMKKPRVAPSPLSIEEIIRKANESEALQRRQAEEAAAALRAAAEQRARAEEEKHLGSKKGPSTSKKGHSDRGSQEINLDEPFLDEADRRLKKLVGEIVVRCMSHYKDDLDRDTFKKHARELTHIICGKEKRSTHSWPPPDGLADGFSKEKAKKIKEFAQQYVKKLVARKGKKKGLGSVKVNGSQEVVSQSNEIVPITPPRPNSHSISQRQIDTEDEDDTSMLEDNQTSLSHSTNGAKGSDRTETSLEEERISSSTTSKMG